MSIRTIVILWSALFLCINTFVKPCSKSFGSQYRCVSISTCSAILHQPVKEMDTCGPENEGQCCPVVHKRSPLTCGIRKPTIIYRQRIQNQVHSQYNRIHNISSNENSTDDTLQRITFQNTEKDNQSANLKGSVDDKELDQNTKADSQSPISSVSTTVVPPVKLRSNSDQTFIGKTNDYGEINDTVEINENARLSSDDFQFSYNPVGSTAPISPVTVFHGDSQHSPTNVTSKLTSSQNITVKYEAVLNDEAHSTINNSSKEIHGATDISQAPGLTSFNENDQDAYKITRASRCSKRKLKAENNSSFHSIDNRSVASTSSVFTFGNDTLSLNHTDDDDLNCSEEDIDEILFEYNNRSKDDRLTGDSLQATNYDFTKNVNDEASVSVQPFNWTSSNSHIQENINKTSQYTDGINRTEEMENFEKDQTRHNLPTSSLANSQTEYVIELSSEVSEYAKNPINEAENSETMNTESTYNFQANFSDIMTGKDENIVTDRSDSNAENVSVDSFIKKNGTNLDKLNREKKSLDGVLNYIHENYKELIPKLISQEMEFRGTPPFSKDIRYLKRHLLESTKGNETLRSRNKSRMLSKTDRGEIEEENFRRIRPPAVGRKFRKLKYRKYPHLIFMRKPARSYFIQNRNLDFYRKRTNQTTRFTKNLSANKSEEYSTGRRRKWPKQTHYYRRTTTKGLSACCEEAIKEEDNTTELKNNQRFIFNRYRNRVENVRRHCLKEVTVPFQKFFRICRRMKFMKAQTVQTAKPSIKSSTIKRVSDTRKKKNTVRNRLKKKETESIILENRISEATDGNFFKLTKMVITLPQQNTTVRNMAQSSTLAQNESISPESETTVPSTEDQYTTDTTIEKDLLSFTVDKSISPESKATNLSEAKGQFIESTTPNLSTITEQAAHSLAFMHAESISQENGTINHSEASDTADELAGTTGEYLSTIIKDGTLSSPFTHQEPENSIQWRRPSDSLVKVVEIFSPSTLPVSPLSMTYETDTSLVTADDKKYQNEAGISEERSESSKTPGIFVESNILQGIRLNYLENSEIPASSFRSSSKNDSLSEATSFETDKRNKADQTLPSSFYTINSSIPTNNSTEVYEAGNISPIPMTEGEDYQNHSIALDVEDTSNKSEAFAEEKDLKEVYVDFPATFSSSDFESNTKRHYGNKVISSSDLQLTSAQLMNVDETISSINPGNNPESTTNWGREIRTNLTSETHDTSTSEENLITYEKDIGSFVNSEVKGKTDEILSPKILNIFTPTHIVAQAHDTENDTTSPLDKYQDYQSNMATSEIKNVSERTDMLLETGILEETTQIIPGASEFIPTWMDSRFSSYSVPKGFQTEIITVNGLNEGITLVTLTNNTNDTKNLGEDLFEDAAENITKMVFTNESINATEKMEVSEESVNLDLLKTILPDFSNYSKTTINWNEKLTSNLSLDTYDNSISTENGTVWRKPINHIVNDGVNKTDQALLTDSVSVPMTIDGIRQMHDAGNHTITIKHEYEDHQYNENNTVKPGMATTSKTSSKQGISVNITGRIPVVSQFVNDLSDSDTVSYYISNSVQTPSPTVISPLNSYSDSIIDLVTKTAFISYSEANNESISSEDKVAWREPIDNLANTSIGSTGETTFSPTLTYINDEKVSAKEGSFVDTPKSISVENMTETANADRNVETPEKSVNSDFFETVIPYISKNSESDIDHSGVEESVSPTPVYKLISSENTVLQTTPIGDSPTSVYKLISSENTVLQTKPIGDFLNGSIQSTVETVLNSTLNSPVLNGNLKQTYETESNTTAIIVEGKEYPSENALYELKDASNKSDVFKENTVLEQTFISSSEALEKSSDSFQYNDNIYSISPTISEFSKASKIRENFGISLETDFNETVLSTLNGYSVEVTAVPSPALLNKSILSENETVWRRPIGHSVTTDADRTVETLLIPLNTSMSLGNLKHMYEAEGNVTSVIAEGKEYLNANTVSESENVSEKSEIFTENTVLEERFLNLSEVPENPALTHLTNTNYSSISENISYESPDSESSKGDENIGKSEDTLETDFNETVLSISHPIPTVGSVTETVFTSSSAPYNKSMPSQNGKLWPLNHSTGSDGNRISEIFSSHNLNTSFGILKKINETGSATTLSLDKYEDYASYENSTVTTEEHILNKTMSVEKILDDETQRISEGSETTSTLVDLSNMSYYIPKRIQTPSLTDDGLDDNVSISDKDFEDTFTDESKNISSENSSIPLDSSNASYYLSETNEALLQTLSGPGITIVSLTNVSDETTVSTLPEIFIRESNNSDKNTEISDVITVKDDYTETGYPYPSNESGLFIDRNGAVIASSEPDMYAKSISSVNGRESRGAARNTFNASVRDRLSSEGESTYKYEISDESFEVSSNASNTEFTTNNFELNNNTGENRTSSANVHISPTTEEKNETSINEASQPSVKQLDELLTIKVNPFSNTGYESNSTSDSFFVPTFELKIISNTTVPKHEENTQAEEPEKNRTDEASTVYLKQYADSSASELDNETESTKNSTEVHKNTEVEESVSSSGISDLTLDNSHLEKNETHVASTVYLDQYAGSNVSEVENETELSNYSTGIGENTEAEESVSSSGISDLIPDDSHLEKNETHEASTVYLKQYVDSSILEVDNETELTNHSTEIGENTADEESVSSSGIFDLIPNDSHLEENETHEVSTVYLKQYVDSSILEVDNETELTNHSREASENTEAEESVSSSGHSDQIPDNSHLEKNETHEDSTVYLKQYEDSSVPKVDNETELKNHSTEAGENALAEESVSLSGISDLTSDNSHLEKNETHEASTVYLKQYVDSSVPEVDNETELTNHSTEIGENTADEESVSSSGIFDLIPNDSHLEENETHEVSTVYLKQYVDSSILEVDNETELPNHSREASENTEAEESVSSSGHSDQIPDNSHLEKNETHEDSTVYLKQYEDSSVPKVDNETELKNHSIEAGENALAEESVSSSGISDLTSDNSHLEKNETHEASTVYLKQYVDSSVPEVDNETESMNHSTAIGENTEAEESVNLSEISELTADNSQLEKNGTHEVSTEYLEQYENSDVPKMDNETEFSNHSTEIGQNTGTEEYVSLNGISDLTSVTSYFEKIETHEASKVYLKQYVDSSILEIDNKTAFTYHSRETGENTEAEQSVTSSGISDLTPNNSHLEKNETHEDSPVYLKQYVDSSILEVDNETELTNYSRGAGENTADEGSVSSSGISDLTPDSFPLEKNGTHEDSTMYLKQYIDSGILEVDNETELANNSAEADESTEAEESVISSRISDESPDDSHLEKNETHEASPVYLKQYIDSSVSEVDNEAEWMKHATEAGENALAEESVNSSAISDLTADNSHLEKKGTHETSTIYFKQIQGSNVPEVVDETELTKYSTIIPTTSLLEKGDAGYWRRTSNHSEEILVRTEDFLPARSFSNAYGLQDMFPSTEKVPTTFISDTLDSPEDYDAGGDVFHTIGGTLEFDEWTWMVSIYRASDMVFICGGSLIDERHVLSAAHCFHGYPDTTLVVSVGSNLKIFKASEGYTVEKLYIHEDFDPPCYCNDIAILRLAQPLNNDYVPVCLPAQDITTVGHNTTLLGWGDTQYGTKSTGTVRLQKVTELPVISPTACRTLISNVMKKNLAKEFEEYYICAGLSDGSKDACLGDSGGPLLQETQDGTYILVGIVSFGYKCGEPDIPGTYSKVSYYLPWILNIIDSYQ